MAHLVNTPQLKFPMQITDNGVVLVVEQDSFEDRVQNAVICLRYQKGQRTMLPEFGLPDQAFRQGGANMNDIVSSILQWEPDVDPVVVGQAMDSVLAEQTVTIEMVSPSVHDDREQGKNG